jgi:DNA replication protein DnaC
MQTLLKALREFKLSGMAASLEERMIYAANSKLSYQELLELLCQDEQSNRKSNNYNKRKNSSKLPWNKKLEEFDFSFQPSIDQRIISDLATCQFTSSKENIIFIGSSGTGKTHLAISLGVKALSKEYSVYFTSVSDLLYELHISRADNSYHKKIKQLLSYDLLILDELGFKQLPKYSADDFFNIIAGRYENKSTIITTNKELSEWNDIFTEPVLTGAITDRLMHHATILNIKGKSYRLKKINNAEEQMR